MDGEHRKCFRRRIVQRAVMSSVGGAAVGPCVIRDISDAGAKLAINRVSQVPEEFVLLLSQNGGVSRQCRVVWRSEREVGVKFVRERAPDGARDEI